MDIGDLADEFMEAWRSVVAAEAPPAEYTQHIQNEVYQCTDNGIATRTYHRSVQMRESRQWHPDVSMVLTHVIAAVKQCRDIENDLQLLEYDIAAMTHFQLTEAAAELTLQRFSSTRMRLAKIARVFGHRVYLKLVELGVYKDGYFPYHFAGWQGSHALVELDDTHVGFPPVVHQNNYGTY